MYSLEVGAEKKINGHEAEQWGGGGHLYISSDSFCLGTVITNVITYNYYCVTVKYTLINSRVVLVVECRIDYSLYSHNNVV